VSDAKNTKISNIFRVQGGTTHNRSRELITLDNDARIVSNTKKPEAIIYISDPRHAKWFLLKRSGLSKEGRNNKEIDRDDRDISDKNLHIIQMTVPDWYQHLLRKYELYPEAGHDFKLKYHRPQIVDPSMPGVSHGISGIWFEALRQSCLAAKRIEVSNMKEMTEMLEDEALTLRTLPAAYRDPPALVKALSRLPLVDEDLDTLKNVHGLNVTRDKRIDPRLLHNLNQKRD